MLKLLLLFVASLSYFAYCQSPLCKFCTCTPTNSAYSSSPIDVICPPNLNIDISNTTYWGNDTTRNRYKSLNIQESDFGNFSIEFPKLGLVSLIMENDHITKITINVFRNLQVLKILKLSNNEIVTLEQDTKENITNTSEPFKYLSELRLNKNKLSGLNPNAFEYNTCMELLDLSENPIENIDQQTLAALNKLTKLRELYLQNTQIKIMPDGFLNSLRLLEVLDISGNPIDTILRSFEKVQKLSHLYMNNTAFTNLTTHNGFPDIQSIKVLHFSHNNQLINIGPYALGGLKNLENVTLSYNKALSTLDQYAFAELTNDNKGYSWLKLKELYISHNNLTYLKPEIFGVLIELTKLDIVGNPWQCYCSNQWLLDKLYPVYIKIDYNLAKATTCTGPKEMANISFEELYVNKTTLKCADNEDNHTISPNQSPKFFTAGVIGFFTGFIISIPIITGIIVGYRRKWYVVRCNYKRFENNPQIIELVETMSEQSV